MASIGAFVGKFFGRTASEAAGVAAGITVARPLAPLAQNVENEFWAAAVALGFKKPLDGGDSAEIVAQRIWDLAQGQSEAALTGRSVADFDSLVQATLKAPGTAEALELWRRGRIDGTQMIHALHKAGLEEQWIKPVMELFGERLDVAALANAIQQGFVDGKGILPADPGGAEPFTPPVSVIALQDAENKPVTTEEEAQASGIDLPRLKVLAELSGNPPGPMELLEMWRRGIITETAVEHGIREGRTKTKWTSAFKALKRPLLNPSVLINLLLRGWITKDEADRRMALHGYDKDQVTDWFDSAGRPATTHQALVGTRRGGVYDGPLTGIPDYFIKAVRQSNIRPEWTHILYHGRETFPSAFVLRMLATRGDIDQTQAHDLLYQNGWPDWLATAASTAWAGGTAATVDARVKSAQTTAITEIKNAYLIGQADEAQARDWLGRLGEPATTQDGLIATWNIMREIPQKGLTAAQIKKAAKSLPTQWPRARALDELQLLGLTADDAATLLDE